MPIGFFAPMRAGSQTQADPFADYVIMSLRMEDSGDGFTLVDDSLHNNTFTRAADAAITTLQKKFGKASAVFDGTGDYYTSPNKTLYNMTGDFSCEFWAYPRAYGVGATTPAYLISHNAGSDDRVACVSLNTAGYLQFHVAGTTVRVSTSPNAIALNTWHHISYGRIGNLYHFYLNGILVGTYTNTDKAAAWKITLGTVGTQLTTTATNKYNGFIDEFRWWKGIAIRDGINSFVPPKAPWAFPPQSIFTPISIVVGTLGTYDFGYNGTVGSITGQPFIGYTVESIIQIGTKNGFDHRTTITMAGIFTEEVFRKFLSGIPPIQLARGSSTSDFNPFVRNASTGVVTATSATTSGAPSSAPMVSGSTTLLRVV